MGEIYGVVYYILNTDNGKGYVGQTIIGIENRWKQHQYWTNMSSPYALYAAIRKYGISLFTIEQVDSASCLEELNEKEKSYIQKFDTFGPNGYNMTAGGGGRLGTKHTEATKKKMSDARLGWDPSKETRHRMSISAIGRKASDETREKISASGRGRIVSEETRLRMSQHNISEETREKLSIARKTWKRVPQEFCQRGHPFDEINTFWRRNGTARMCATCYYLVSGRNLPVRLLPYFRMTSPVLIRSITYAKPRNIEHTVSAPAELLRTVEGS